MALILLFIWSAGILGLLEAHGAQYSLRGFLNRRLGFFQKGFGVPLWSWLFPQIGSSFKRELSAAVNGFRPRGLGMQAGRYGFAVGKMGSGTTTQARRQVFLETQSHTVTSLEQLERIL